MSEFTGEKLFSEGRLLGLLGSVREEKVGLTIKLQAELPSFQKCPQHKYWDFFLNSIQGVVLSDVGVQFLDPKKQDRQPEIAKEQASRIFTNRGLVYSGKQVAVPVWDSFHSPPPAPFLIAGDIHSFYGALSGFIFEHLGLRTAREFSIHKICEFAREAYQNSQLHGSVTLDNEPISALRFISLKRQNVPHGNSSLLQLSSLSDEAEYSQYIALLGEKWRKTVPKYLVHLTVADSGVGIAAKMARAEGVENIYAGSYAEESAILLKAFTKHGTSRPKSEAGVGMGLFKILQATKELDGFLSVRCGRLWMQRHFLSPSLYRFSTDVFPMDANEYSLIVGTSVHLVFPWW